MRTQITIILLVSFFSMFFSLGLRADNPPDPGGNPTGDPVGGGSPIGGGLVVTLLLSAAYGSKKTYDLLK